MSKQFEGFSQSVGQIINRWKLLLRYLRSCTPLLALGSQNYPCGHAEGETITHFPHHSHLPQHRTVLLLVGICTQRFISQSLSLFQTGWCYIFCAILTTWDIYSPLHILGFPTGCLPSWTSLKHFHMKVSGKHPDQMLAPPSSFWCGEAATPSLLRLSCLGKCDLIKYMFLD